MSKPVAAAERNIMKTLLFLQGESFRVLKTGKHCLVFQHDKVWLCKKGDVLRGQEEHVFLLPPVEKLK